jgi:hypothetical protein
MLFYLRVLYYTIPGIHHLKKMKCKLLYTAGIYRRFYSVALLNLLYYLLPTDRLCGLVVRVLGYSSGGPGSIPGTTRKKK